MKLKQNFDEHGDYKALNSGKQRFNGQLKIINNDRRTYLKINID